MKDAGEVTTEVRNKIANIRFYHPKGNSLPTQLLIDLTKLIKDLSNNPDAKVIVISSRGDKAFCAGASFDELQEIQDIEQGKEFFMGFARLILAMRDCPKFIISRVQGKVVGGGNGIVASSDYALALDTADVRLSELSIGIGPFVIGPSLERRMGITAFSCYAIDTEWRSALWAKQHGLYNEVFDSVTSLDNGVLALAEKLSTFSLEAMQELKKIFWEGTENWDSLLERRAEISGRLVLTDYVKKIFQSYNLSKS